MTKNPTATETCMDAFGAASEENWKYIMEYWDKWITEYNRLSIKEKAIRKRRVRKWLKKLI